MSDPVARLNAALEVRYRIESQLGEGGMATVYLAGDLKHERKVALKVLKPELAAVVGGERFLAEIKTTANLQHPHILPLFDSGEADGFLYYVMPYVDGESLRERLDREKQLPVDEVLAVATKVAGALQAAHDEGVIHRDIKPANILFSKGEPLVSDFGIALAVGIAGGGRLTETGLSLGTPHYMSPEQATGDVSVGPATDIYALGCVIYEMLAGQPPFAASTAQAVLVQILTADAPSIAAARRTVPGHVADAIARALEKLPADRFASASDFGEALGDEGYSYQARPRTTTVSAARAHAQVRAPAFRSWLRDPRSLVAVMAVILLGGWSLLRGAASPLAVESTLRASLTDFDARAPLNSGLRLAISRDGSHIAVVSSTLEGGPRLHLRRADEREFREVPETEGAADPSFSPDGAWVMFTLNDQIVRTEVSGGPILPVTEGDAPHWGLQEMVVFDQGDGLAWVPPSGGQARMIVRNDAASPAPSRPWLLPDGRAVLFQAEGADGRTVMLAEIESGEVTDLGLGGSNPRYLPTGHIAYGHESQVLMAVPFDLETHRVTGEPSTVLPSVLVYTGGWVQFAVSEAGTAVYALSEGVTARGLEMVLVDPDGAETRSPLGPGGYEMPRFSRDGRYVAYDDVDQIRIWDREAGANPALADGNNIDYVAWPRDSPYVYFSSIRAGSAARDIYRRVADRSAEEEHVLRREGLQVALSGSPDGTVLIAELTSDRGWDLLIMSEGPDRAIVSDFLVAPWDEVMGAISPEGDRIAYVSDESGAPEVYVRSFPGGDNQLRISEDGGSEPVWAPDGSALYYLAGGALWRAELGGAGVTGRTTLFEGTWGQAAFPGTNWDVHPDGAPFVFVRSPASAGVTGGLPSLHLELAVNWFDELRERLGN